MDHNPQFFLRGTYLHIIRSSVGTPMFRQCFFNIRGRRSEVLGNGKLACAFFVSSVLKIFDLISELHTTVDETERDLFRNGWQRISRPRVGCIVIYKPQKFPSGEIHRHIGFYIGNGYVVDNNSVRRSPGMRRWNFRPVETLLWHRSLERH